MKNLLSILGLCALLAVQGCNSQERPENKASVDKVNPGERDSPNVNDANVNENPANTATAEAEMAYVCPMRCEGSASNEPGKCPVCKMDLVKNANYKGGMNSNEVINHEPSESTGQSRTTDDNLEKQPQ